jgi:signal transduction histidine kinase/ligand-binding sensor domain-containing protein
LLSGVLAILCFVNLAGAMDPNRAVSQYARIHWAAEQAFPGGVVHAISETADGYLWIGAEKGLVRFDGVNFRLFNHVNTPGMPSGPVLDLATGADGGLWIRMQSPRMLRYRNGIFEDVPAEFARIDTPVTAMSRQERGDMLFVTLSNALFRYSDGKLIRLGLGHGQPNFLVVSLAQTADGAVWFGTRDSGLLSWRTDDTSTTRGGLRDSRINCVLPGRGNELWIGTDTGLIRWDGTRITEEGIPEPLRRIQILHLTKDQDSNVWVGTPNGLARVNARGFSLLSDHGAAPVTAIFEDRAGNLWTGGPQGIDRLRDSQFLTYTTFSRQPEHNGPLYVDEKNRTWFAPSDGGLFWLKGTAIERITVAGLDHDLVYSIAGSRGELWVGRQRGGLTHLIENGGSFNATSYTHKDGLAQDTVYSVARTRDGSVWAGTLNGGVSRFQNGRFTNYTTANGLVSDSVSSILEGSDGTVWLATANGLNAFAKGQWRSFTGSEGFPSGHLNCLTEDQDGVIWIGAPEGLAFVRAGRVQVPREVPASLREEILGIAADTRGWLWVATAQQVLRVKRDSLLVGIVSDGDVRAYGTQDGLQAAGGVKRDHSVTTDSHGHIWFSMSLGISELDPARVTRKPVPAIVHMQAISADGSPLDLAHTVRISSSVQRILFTYSGLSLSAPDRVKYRYMLEPFDRSWSAPTVITEAGYSNLPPGPYRFRVMASDVDGVWNGVESVTALEIQPMFWQTWWFGVAAALTCALAITAMYRFRMRRLTWQLNLRFEERLGERTRIAQELHDTLLQGILSASMQLDVAADRLPADSPVRAALGNVLELMKRVIDEGRNTVQGLRSVYSGPQDLGKSFSTIKRELAVPEEIDFRVIVEGQPRPLHPILRDEVYRIGREALVNSFRHSQATRVEMEIQYDAKRLRVFVRDSGCGIDPQVLRSGREGHWGLPGMRERAERIGAQLHVWSSPAAGTEVELSIPGHLAFQYVASSRVSPWFRWNRRKRWTAGRIDPEGSGIVKREE